MKQHPGLAGRVIVVVVAIIVDGFVVCGAAVLCGGYCMMHWCLVMDMQWCLVMDTKLCLAMDIQWCLVMDIVVLVYGAKSRELYKKNL